MGTATVDGRSKYFQEVKDIQSKEGVSFKEAKALHKQRKAGDKPPRAKGGRKAKLKVPEVIRQPEDVYALGRSRVAELDASMQSNRDQYAAMEEEKSAWVAILESFASLRHR